MSLSSSGWTEPHSVANVRLRLMHLADSNRKKFLFLIGSCCGHPLPCIPRGSRSFYIFCCPALASLKGQDFWLLLMPLSFLALAFSTYPRLLPSAPGEERGLGEPWACVFYPSTMLMGTEHQSIVCPLSPPWDISSRKAGR